MNTAVLLVGLGRPRCGDDAAGLLIAQELSSRLVGVAEVVLDETGGWRILEAVSGHQLLVIVDAADAAGELPPGGHKKLAYPGDAAAIMERRGADTHTLGLDATLRLGQALGQLPPETWIYAVAGEQFEPETELSIPVRDRLGQVSDEVERDIRRWQSERQIGGVP